MRQKSPCTAGRAKKGMVLRPLWHQQPCFPQRVQGSGDKRRNRFSQTQENIGTSRILLFCRLRLDDFFSNVRL